MDPVFVRVAGNLHSAGEPGLHSDEKTGSGEVFALPTVAELTA